jgi:hypothetical protein
MKKTTLISFLLVIVIGSFAQSKDETKYRKESEEMRKQVWAWDDPKFKVKDIPQQYANASKVIIAHHTDLTADSKSKIAFYGFGFGAKKEQSLTEVVREIVKVNDKNAVDEYSELSFTRFTRSSGFFTDDKMTTYIGVKVIKPNGSVKEINADDIVLTKDATSEKKAKVAIPDLQPGDVLDYFIASEHNLTNDMSNKAYQILLFDDAPILSLSFHAQLGKKYAVEYRSYNGAPELKVDKNNDKEIIIDVEKTNIPPFETSLWASPARQLPFIRLNFSLGYSGMGSKYLNTRKPGEVNKITSSEEAVEDLANDYSKVYYDSYWMRYAKMQWDEIENDAKSKAKQMGINFASLKDEEKANFLFYTYRFNRLLQPDLNDIKSTINRGSLEYRGLTHSLFFTFKAAGLEPAMMISDDRTGFRMNEAMNGSDLLSTTYLQGSNKFYSIWSIYDLPLDVPAAVEGVKNTKSFTFDHPGAIMSYKKMADLTNVGPGPNAPVSTAEKNARIEKMNISLNPEQGALVVNRNTTLRGFYKVDAQRNLILYEDYYENERNYFKGDKSLLEYLESNKNTKKYAGELRNAFAEARKNYKDAFVKDAKEWFGQDVTNIKDFKVENMGVRHTSPDFVYSSTFNLNGLVKKAGNNLIVEIGKLQGQPLSVKEEQRKRTVDVYAPFARSIGYLIELAIPDGYTVDGVQALNTKAENETGLFIVEASSTDKLVTIKVRKQYLHNYEPAANFDKMLAFIDASNTWLNAKLLFKKK